MKPLERKQLITFAALRTSGPFSYIPAHQRLVSGKTGQRLRDIRKMTVLHFKLVDGEPVIVELTARRYFERMDFNAIHAHVIDLITKLTNISGRLSYGQLIEVRNNLNAIVNNLNLRYENDTKHVENRPNE